MILKEIYITSFGNLENYKLDFSKDLNSFCFDNGYGKTTITYFLRAMFYGLAKSSKNQFIRRRVTPFNKTQFGGYLIYVDNGKTYKIERTFGKSNTDDTLTVYVDGRESDELGDTPGLKLFNLDEESFNKTIFITPKDLTFSADGNLKTKLGHYVDSEDESIGYDKTLENLDKYRKTFVPDKEKDKNGLIANKKKEILDLENDQSQLNSFKDSLEEHKNRFDQLNNDIKKIQEELSKASSLNGLIKDWESYDRFQNNVDELKKNIAEINASYPRGIPLDEEIEIIKNKEKEKEEARSKLNNLELNDNEKEQYELLQNHFAKSVPSEEEINLLKEKHDQYRTLLNQKMDTLTDKELSLIAQFDNKNIDEDVLKEDLSKYRELVSESLNNQTISNNKKAKTKPIKEIVIASISSLFIIAGLIAGILVHPLLFIPSVLGLISLFFDAFIYLKNQINNKVESSINNSSNSELQRKRNALFLKISATLEKVGYTVLTENEVEEKYAKFVADFALYNDAKTRQNVVNEANSTLKSSVLKTEKQLEEIYSKYHYDGPENDNYDQLNKDIALYKNFLERLKYIEENKNSLLAKIALLNDDVSSFLKKYEAQNFDEFVLKLENDKTRLKVFEDNLKQANVELDQFKKEHQLKDRPAVSEVINIDELNNKNNELNKEIARENQEIGEIENSILSLENKLSFLDEYKEELQTLNYKYGLVKNTISHLKKAEDSLKSKYIDPVKNSLVKYIDPLEETLGKKLGIDPDFNLYYIEEGKQRDYRHLSDGILTLVLLSYKLAILDNIFTTDKPFIILDDIFAYLDKDNLEKAKELIKKISSNKQILYFTCYSNRDIA